MKCGRCPIADGPCVVELDARRAHLCAKAERGTPSDQAQIRALTARQGGRPAPAYPSVATQAGNFARAAVRFVASGLATVDRAEFDRRKAACEACPNFDASQDRCRLCGCSLAVKPWSKAETCPENRWEIE